MKTLKNMFVALMICTTLLSAKPSQAAIGVIFSPVLVTAGLVLAGGGVVATLTTSSNQGGLAQFLIGLYIVAIGLVVLEGEQEMLYAPLSPEQGKIIGLTKVELNSYNAEIDQINILTAHVDAEVATIKDATEADAANIWTSVKDTLAPETFSALVKVTAQIYK